MNGRGEEGEPARLSTLSGVSFFCSLTGPIAGRRIIRGADPLRGYCLHLPSSPCPLAPWDFATTLPASLRSSHERPTCIAPSKIPDITGHMPAYMWSRSHASRSDGHATTHAAGKTQAARTRQANAWRTLCCTQTALLMASG